MTTWLEQITQDHQRRPLIKALQGHGDLAERIKFPIGDELRQGPCYGLAMAYQTIQRHVGATAKDAQLEFYKMWRSLKTQLWVTKWQEDQDTHAPIHVNGSLPLLP